MAENMQHCHFERRSKKTGPSEKNRTAPLNGQKASLKTGGREPRASRTGHENDGRDAGFGQAHGGLNLCVSRRTGWKEARGDVYDRRVSTRVLAEAADDRFEIRDRIGAAPARRDDGGITGV